MEQRPTETELPGWRETPLDHWSTDVDPAVMSCEEWVTPSSDSRYVEDMQEMMPGDPFLHPTHNTER
jgi:Protein of unknown function (DUF3905)